jgi:serine O-acetyltransferase
MSFLQKIYEDLKIINPSPLSMIFNCLLSNSFHVVFIYRLSHILSHTPLKIFARILNALCRIIYSCDIAPEAIIGRRILLMHGFGIVIGAEVVIGNDAKIYNDITIGNRKGGHNDGQAIIGHKVVIGCGARLLGEIKLGDNVTIGANSVVITDVPNNATAIGVPAKIRIMT